MAAVDIVQVVGQVVGSDVGAVVHGIGRQARGGVFKIAVVGNGHAAAEQLQTVEIDGEVAHVFLHKRQGEQHAKGKRQHHEGLLQLVHAQQRRADALHAALGHVHGDDGVGVDVVEVLVGQGLLQLLDANHAALFALGLAFAGPILGRALDLVLGQILDSLIFVVVAFEQCHGDQSLYLARM